MCQKLSNAETESYFYKNQTPYHKIPKLAIVMCLISGLILLFAALWTVFSGTKGDLVALIVVSVFALLAPFSFAFLVIKTHKNKRREIANFSKNDEIYTIYNSSNDPTTI